MVPNARATKVVSLTRENIVAVNSDFAGAMNSEDEDERESSLTFLYAALPRTKKIQNHARV